MDSAARPDEEEATRRRSTDCIYFLASPLTCNKGSECDYRHSDAARMNPRDCWYWFNGNCANPKCSFRHPPLENLLGASPSTPRAAQQSAPQQQVSVPPQAHGSISASGTAKQGVPCYYFQKGMCAKGDRCAFLHAPQSAGNPASQQAAKGFTPVVQPNPQLKNSWTKTNPSQQNTPPGIFDKSTVSPYDGKPAQKQNLSSRVDHSSRTYQNHNSSYVQSATPKHHQLHPSVEDDLTKNGMVVGEDVRESSAGSGVLVSGVNDDTEKSLKGNHNSYHRTNGEQHTGILRKMNSSYESERSYRSSTERLSLEKRIPQRELMPVTTGGSDLRHRLLKQRRLNSSRLPQAPDRDDAYLEDERNVRHRWQGEEQAAHDGLSRSRLRDRIKLPGETSFDGFGPLLEKERDRGPRARVSPPPKHTDLRGKLLHERLKARSNEDITGNAKGLVAKACSGEDDGSLNFAGPKSLAELKANKIVGSSGDGAIKSFGSSAGAGPVHTSTQIVASRVSSDPAPFEGPKPLSDILKRKREAAHSGGIHEEKDTVGVEEEPMNKLQNLENETVDENMDGNVEEEEEPYHNEDDVMYEENLSPIDDNTDEVAGDAGKELDEQQDLEGEEDYDYEAGDINGEEDNDYQEYEDDDDLAEDDDFARKVGVMTS